MQQRLKQINRTENTRFFSAPETKLSIFCDYMVDKINKNNNKPSIETQQEKLKRINEANNKNHLLIQDVVKTISEKFGTMVEVNGKQIPIQGDIFTGIFGKEPTEIEQISRIDMIKIAQKYSYTEVDSATETMATLKKELKNFEALNESIAKGKEDVLAVANESNYPTWLIALFCIPIIGQIGWGIFELIRCLPHPETDEPSISNNTI